MAAPDLFGTLLRLHGAEAHAIRAACARLPSRLLRAALASRNEPSVVGEGRHRILPWARARSDLRKPE